MAIDFKVRCDEVVERVTDYLEGSMTLHEREQLEQHFVICSACATYLEQLRATVRLSGALAASEPLAEHRLVGLMERFRQHHG